jgi:guanylate kinase
MLARFPERVAIVKSLTTRPRRGPEDDPNYDFVSVEEMRRMERDGELVQVSEYAGNLYAHGRKYDELLKDRIGICALVEQGVRNLRNAGYDVKVVKIIPHGGEAKSEARAEADIKRAKDGVASDFEIVNSFEPGGLERAERDFADLVLHNFL